MLGLVSAARVVAAGVNVSSTAARAAIATSAKSRSSHGPILLTLSQVFNSLHCNDAAGGLKSGRRAARNGRARLAPESTAGFA